MQQSWVTKRDRAGALSAVLLIHAALLAGLLTLGQSQGPPAGEASPPLELFDISPDVPPPPEPVEVETRKAPEEEGAAAPPARKAQASPVVAPEPKVELPRRPPVTASETPGKGSAPTQGAAPVDGPGTGADGQGSGTGSGSGGSGTGGGGGAAERPALVSRSLTQRDYGSASRRAWPQGARVLVSFDVQLNGRASGCRVIQSSGVASIDAETCRLVTAKLRFRPARDRQGNPVVERYGYLQYPLF
jgi:protein TonB